MERETAGSPISVGEYVALEQAGTERHEFIEGFIYALAGAPERHNEIVLNIATAFRSAARGTSCRVRALEIILRVSEQRFYYPDVLVTCGIPGSNEPFVANPCVVVEGLPPATASIDRREKLLAYRGIPSLLNYLVVHQDARRVEQHRRTAEGGWRREDITGDGSVRVDCLDAAISLDDIYAQLPLLSA